MKSCLGLLLSLLILVAVLAVGAGIWYLSTSAEFSRKDGQSSQQSPVSSQQ
jgi:Tfp pilus assembly protein PilW